MSSRAAACQTTDCPRPRRAPARGSRLAAIWSVTLVVAVGSIFTLVGLGGGPSHVAKHQRVHAGLTALPLGARGVVSSALGAADAAYHPTAVAGGFVAANAAQRLHIDFRSSGVEIHTGNAAVGLSLSAVGYGSALHPVANATPTTAGNRVAYARGALTEWYSNGPLGLEQGFTLSRPPAHVGNGPLTIAIVVSGDAHASLASRGASLTLTRGNRPEVRYGSLFALDARGHALHSWMTWHAGRLLLHVADRGASYPIRIDPLVQQGAKLTPEAQYGQAGFGAGVALSGDGNTALIGGEYDKGPAWVFVRSGSSWSLQATLVAHEPTGESVLDSGVALSADGNTAVVGGKHDGEGSAWVFTRSGSSWTQQGSRLVPSGGAREVFGRAIALSADGDTVLIGDWEYENRGAAWVFTRSGSTWTQQGGKLTGGGEAGDGSFGLSVALSADGNTALIGANNDDGAVGAAWVFTRSGETWSQQGEKLTGADATGHRAFGYGVALSADGDTALVGGWLDDESRGGAWVFTRSGETWTQQGPALTANDASAEAAFGIGVALSADGNTALIGGWQDEGVGAVWLFGRANGEWTQQGAKITAEGETGDAGFGYKVALSEDATTALVGGLIDNEQTGAAWVFVNQSAPVVVTGSASRIGQTSAVLNATVNPGALEVTSCRFEYGTTASYGSSVPCASPPGSGTHAAPVSTSIAGLTPGSEYHYRIVATNSLGTSSGTDRQLTTPKPALPELGRCVQLAGATTGRYKNAACTTPSAGEDTGRYEWQPWPASGNGFTATGGASAFELVNQTSMQCTGMRLTGEFTGSQVASLSATLQGCAVAGVFGGNCHSASDPAGEVTTALLLGTLGVIKAGSSPSIGIESKPSPGTQLANFECGATKTSITGAVIASITSTNKMGDALTLKWAEVKGHQTPEGFEGAPTSTLEFTSKNAEEQAGLSGTATLMLEEPLEIKATA